MSDPSPTVDTVIVGAGQAGLAVSRCLQRKGVEHVILERHRVGASWRTRWDSFRLNTPAHASLLPDAETSEHGAFLHRDDWIAEMEAYTSRHDLPTRTGVVVRSIRFDGTSYEVRTSVDLLRARNVVLCTGDQNVPRIPGLARDLPEDIVQLHTSEYQNPGQLPEGGVLVVGSGQSGTQVVEELREAGRPTWLCTSRVGRGPRRYRGRDLLDWMLQSGLADQGPQDVEDAERNAAQVLISGTRGGHSMSLQGLCREGAILLGRLVGVDGRTLRIGEGLLDNVEAGDQATRKLRTMLDAYIAQMGIDAPPAEPDPADLPCEGLADMAAIRSLDLDEAGIRTVIWATGFGGDFSYLPAEWLDEHAVPRHTDGVCASPGLYCLGLKWQQRRISGLILGAGRDAEHIAGLIAGS